MAINKGNELLVTLLVKAGRHIERPLSAGMTVLHLAIRYARTSLVEVLLHLGANIEAKRYGVTALFAAVQSGRRDVVELLLDRGADIQARRCDRNTALHTAASFGWQVII